MAYVIRKGLAFDTDERLECPRISDGEACGSGLWLLAYSLTRAADVVYGVRERWCAECGAPHPTRGRSLRAVKRLG